MPAATPWPEGRGTKPTIHPPPFFLLSRIALFNFTACQKNIRSPKADISTFEERFLFLSFVGFMLLNSTLFLFYIRRKRKVQQPFHPICTPKG